MNQDLFHKLLDYYKIDEATYKEMTKEVNIANFASGHHFDNMEKATSILNDVISHNGKIFIYGDYDADGIMGTSILVKMLLYKNVNAEYYIPNRYQDGYGLTLKKAKECIDNHVELLICVDNGVAAIEPIKLLKENGVKVLVLDHHTIQDELPNADVILHPEYSHFGNIAASGGFVAFMFSISFLGYFDKYLSILASISLISDMMPLKEYNRDLLRLVFSMYQDGEFFTIDALKEGEIFNEVTIGMRIAPKINAIGRIIDGYEINRLVTYFTKSTKDDMLNYIEWINSVNEERKIASKEAAEGLKDMGSIEDAIVYIRDVKEGLLGLIANSLVNTYHLPTIVLTKDNSGHSYKGSARAMEGFNIVACFEALKDYIEVYGGHPAAGGCTIKEENIEEFTKAFKEYSKNHPVEHIEKEAINFSILDINMDNYRLIQTFAPFGEAHKAPLLRIKNLFVPSLSFSRSGEHIFSPLGNGMRIKGFNISKESLSGVHYITAIGALNLDTYRGYQTVEFIIKEYEIVK